MDAVQNDAQPLLLTVGQAAMRLGVSRSHFYSMVLAKGRLRVVHIGRSARIVASHLDALVEALAAEGGEPR